MTDSTRKSTLNFFCNITEWTKMCQQARNIEKFGVANPDRKQRHTLCKKQIDTEESDRNTSDDENSSNEYNIEDNVYV